MTFEIALVLGILAISLILFVSEVIRMDLVALLVLSGEPIDEPVVAHGPFVMNTREEIAQAIADYHKGRMGSLD